MRHEIIGDIGISGTRYLVHCIVDTIHNGIFGRRRARGRGGVWLRRGCESANSNLRYISGKGVIHQGKPI